MLTSRNLAAQPGLRHGFFTRQGGTSSGVFASLNCGLGSGDAPDRLAENRRRVLRRLGALSELVTLRQVHSVRVVTVTAAPRKRAEADALVTDRPDLALGILTADCAPVLFADATAGVIGAAHAGWSGALNGVVDATLAAMEKRGAVRGRIDTAIGPCIAQNSYEVGPEYRDRFLQVDDRHDAYFLVGASADRFWFDLRGFIADQLADSGVKSVAVLGNDTYLEADRFFSYRRSCHQNKTEYGRQISVIARFP